MADAFVARVSASGIGVTSSGYIGGGLREIGEALALDASGNAYVAGWTTSTETTFPVKVGPDLTFNGGRYGDAFVAKVVSTFLQGNGTFRPGTRVVLTLTAGVSAGLRYQLGSSLGTGPIRIGNRQVGLTLDNLLVVSVAGYWPWIFSGYQGVIGANGQAKAAINIPNLAALVGQKIHTAFVTLSASAPSGVKSISNTHSFTIQ